MKGWNWEGFWGYFTNLYLLEGALWTIGLTISTLILGGMLGLLLAVMRLSKHKALADAVVGALNELKKDGFYDKLLDQYGVLKMEGSTFAISGPGPA